MPEKVVDLQLFIRCEPDLIFDSLTDPEIVKLWWRSPDFYQVTEFQMDRRRGGNWSMNALGVQGKPFQVHGIVLEFDRPRRLAFTWNPSWQPMATTKVQISLDPVPDGAMLRLVHSGFSLDAAGYEAHLYGWPHVLDWLSNYLGDSEPIHRNEQE
ncbi:SRPBCC domain-containing protein [bacterium]|nr:SRPBCC domain-containing protein [bacterium]